MKKRNHVGHRLICISNENGEVRGNGREVYLSCPLWTLVAIDVLSGNQKCKMK